MDTSLLEVPHEAAGGMNITEAMSAKTMRDLDALCISDQLGKYLTPNLTNIRPKLWKQIWLQEFFITR